MLIQAKADILLQSKSLVEALREFATLVRLTLSVGQDAEVSITLDETGSRCNEVLARSLPGDAKGFGVGNLPASWPLTAAQFRESIALDKAKKTHSQVRVKAAAVNNWFSLLNGLSEALPSSGRGVMLLINLTGCNLELNLDATVVDVSFSRILHGAHDISASAWLQFQALGLKDPIVAETIAAASEKVKLRFGKPIASFAADKGEMAKPSAASPMPDAQMVLLAFDEVMARAAERIGAHPEDLASIPLLFSHSGSFDKRMHDVRAGLKENVNLASRLKRYMKESFPEYRFDVAGPDQLWFRKALASSLDALLMFDKIHHYGLGKSFSLEFATDFPNTSFAGLHRGWGGTRKSIFWMFHEGWAKRVWAYTTSAELTTALDGCGELLRRILPATEEECQNLLLPPPTNLPKGIIERGALSARQAYELVLPMAREWSGDAELETIGSSHLLGVRERFGPAWSSIEEDGRLQPQGSWTVTFVSKRIDRHSSYVVPHTGRVWWNFYPVLDGAIPKYNAVLESDDWVDSTVVAQRAFQAVQRQLGDFRSYAISLVLHDPKRYTGHFVWEAHCISYAASTSERHDITVRLDRRTGEVLENTMR